MVGINNWDEVKIIKKASGKPKLEFSSSSKIYAIQLDHIVVKINGVNKTFEIKQTKNGVGFNWSPLSEDSTYVKYIATMDSTESEIDSFDKPTEIKYFDKDENEITPEQLFVSMQDEKVHPFTLSNYQFNDKNELEKIEVE